MGKVDLPQKLLPGEYHELSNRMYFPSFFKFTTAEGLLVPKNQGTPASLVFWALVYGFAAGGAGEALDPQFEVRLLPELIS